MGQSDSKEIQQNVTQLQTESIIQHSQAQKFLHDYHTNDPAVYDVRIFQDNKLKLFLKYFILEKYAGRPLQKQNTKRVRTNQSGVSNEEKNYDNLIGSLCFETYRIEECMTKICELITKFTLTPTAEVFDSFFKEILGIAGIKECHFIQLNKNNVQQIKVSYTQQKCFLTIKSKGLQQSPFPRTTKYRFRKLNKTKILQQKLTTVQNQLCSQQYFVSQIPSKQKCSILMVNFSASELMQAKSQKRQLVNMVEKFVSEISDFIFKIVSCWDQQHSIGSIDRAKKQQKCGQSLEQEPKNFVADVCWNMLKMFKTSFDFQHSLFLEKLKNENKNLIQNSLIENSLHHIKQKIEEALKNVTDDPEIEEQIMDFMSQYEKKYSSIKSDLSMYLHKYFQAITQDTLEFYFDSNTELKVLISSKQTDESRSFLKSIRQIIQKGNQPTLLDIFKGQTTFQEFYKNSYKEAHLQMANKKVFEYEGVSIQFKFNAETLSSIIICVSLDVRKHQKQSKQNKTPTNSQNIIPTRKTSRVQRQCLKNDEDKENRKSQISQTSSELIRISVKDQHEKQTSSMKISVRGYSKKNLSILDLTESESFGDADIYDPEFNILELEKPKHFQLAFKVVNELEFYKKNAPKSVEVKFINFLECLKGGYQQHNNPFHNFTHGVNVMHTAFLLSSMKKMGQFLTDFSKFALVLSGLCHDVGHTGFNNAYEVASGSALAQAFNDNSPLQNYHISVTLKLLKRQQSNFLQFLSPEQRTKMRKLIISNILNTDMKQHFNVLKKFEQKKNNFKLDDIEDQKIICGMLIHSSDFGGSVKEFTVCKQWSRLVNEQFKNQSRMQKELGLPLSPFMLNLQKQVVMAKNQLGFLKFMVQPLYKSISEVFNDERTSYIMFDNVNKNIGGWQLMIKQLTEQES